MGIRRSDPTAPGIRRIRSGRGFRYVDANGAPVRNAAVRQRIKDLTIPPAWTDVWICPDQDGHIQAVGRDAAGRLQYCYHDRWRAARDREKYNRVVAFGERLPAIRAAVAEHLDGRGLTRNRVLAAAVRLLDLGFFRIGGEEYAEENESFGLATIRRDHVQCSKGSVHFTYLAKFGKEREHRVVDNQVYRVVAALMRRRGGGEELLAFRNGQGWQDVRSEDINGYLKDVAGDEFTAKDFRTWHATVLAAVGLAVSVPAPKSRSSRVRVVARVVQEVADHLGNTPAVCRASYIDPRIIKLYERGQTIANTLERLGAESDAGQLATVGAVEEAVQSILHR
jgi:DNA topoisomerase IB